MDLPRSPSSALLPYRKKGTLILTSLLEDLVTCLNRSPTCLEHRAGLCAAFCFARGGGGGGGQGSAFPFALSTSARFLTALGA